MSKAAQPRSYQEHVQGAHSEAWLERIKAIALFWIVLNHIAERLFGFPHFANPVTDWPPMAERIAQWAPHTGHGASTLPLNILRYIGWTGDQGVQLFLIASGFGLTWGLLRHNSPDALPLRTFYARRIARIYPMWWGSHLFFIATGLLGWGLSVSDPRTYASMLGIRFTPGLFYYFAPAWWYIGLLLQLYAIYPLLWQALRRTTPWRFFLALAVISFVLRGVGLYFFDGYLDYWSRGAIFITRLPEFAFGMALAAWMHAAPAPASALLRHPTVLGSAILLYLLGTALAFTLWGMTVAPFLMGLGAFVVLRTLVIALERPGRAGGGPLMWTGRHTYSLYLLHGPLVTLCVPWRMETSMPRLWLGIAAVFVLMPLVAMVFEGIVKVVTAWVVTRLKQRPLRLLMGLASLGLITIGGLFGGELAVRTFAPQEVYGWGERPALEPHATYSWRMKPESTTRLRWLSYDYTAQATEEGFPAPAYPEVPPENGLRILVFGDAYTSAEGVDTSQAWPRLLEAKLAQHLPGTPVEVLNFAVTGYGPVQTAAVAEAMVPRYQPDLVIYGFYNNEFTDVQIALEDFHASIGFGRPSAFGGRSLLTQQHLRSFVGHHVADSLRAWLRAQPQPRNFFFGGFRELETARRDELHAAAQAIRPLLARIKNVAGAAGARTLLMLIPAPVQVCDPEALPYFPRGVDLNDAGHYDLDQPQRIATALAAEAGLPTLDLRAPLRAAVACPYMKANLHWTPQGHETVAAFLANHLLETAIVEDLGDARSTPH
jgi:peptidoglycan/LPS O-acetylase OafA/YrhL